MRATRPAVPARDPQGILDALVKGEVASAAVGWIGSSRQRLWSGAAGRTRRQSGRALSVSTRFDLASLTKPFTATLAIALDRSGDLPLALPIGELWPRADLALARRPLESLLRHRSGLVAWAPLALCCRTVSQVPGILTSGKLLGGPAPLYSDLGYILWALSVQRHLGSPFAKVLAKRVLAPLRLASIGPPPGPRPEVAQSLLDGSRESEMARAQGLTLKLRLPPRPGSVQDGNARFLGGLSGHAGLFGDAASVAALGREWLTPRRLLRDGDTARCLGGPRGPYGLGWARRRVGGSAGGALSAGAFGHTAFTGGSLWVDPERDLIAVLLTHRICGAVDMNTWRREFHSAARALLEAGSSP